MGIFSDLEDYTVDKLQQIALELYDRAYYECKGHGTPEQVKMMAEWTAVNLFRKKMRINSHKVAVPRSLLPAELLNRQRELYEFPNLAAMQQPAHPRPRAKRYANPGGAMHGVVIDELLGLGGVEAPLWQMRADWEQAFPEPVANPFFDAPVVDPF